MIGGASQEPDNFVELLSHRTFKNSSNWALLVAQLVQRLLLMVCSSNPIYIIEHFLPIVSQKRQT